MVEMVGNNGFIINKGNNLLVYFYNSSAAKRMSERRRMPSVCPSYVYHQAAFIIV